MAWTPPDTRTAGDVFSAAAYNTYLRDNLTYLHAGKPLAALARANGSVYTVSASAWAAVDATHLAPTLTLSTGRVLIACVGSFYADAASRLLSLDVAIDGTRIGGTDGLLKTTLDTNAQSIAFTILHAGLSAGSHSFTLMWRVGSGIASLFSGTDVAVHFTVAEW
ncbi:MAG: hypothetical protein HS103_07110 [Anaerolineales bacterium]|nr:hypothetical protein [Anaerolineales bacterium]